MPIPSRQLLIDSEAVLIRAEADYAAPNHSTNAREFYELRVQFAIFNYEVTRQLVSLWVLEPKGLALKVSLKDLVHKLFEYEDALSKRLVRRLLALAVKRNLDVRAEHIKSERQKWRKEFQALSDWVDLRNQATGHYGKDIANQLALIQSIDREQVIDVARAFLAYNLSINKTLARIGQHGN